MVRGGRKRGTKTYKSGTPWNNLVEAGGYAVRSRQYTVLLHPVLDNAAPPAPYHQVVMSAQYPAFRSIAINPLPQQSRRHFASPSGQLSACVRATFPRA